MIFVVDWAVLDQGWFGWLVMFLMVWQGMGWDDSFIVWMDWVDTIMQLQDAPLVDGYCVQNELDL